MLSGVQRRDRHFLVLRVRRADGNDLDRRIGEQNAIIVGIALVAARFRRLARHFDAARADVLERYAEVRARIKQRDVAERLGVRAPHESPADQADADGFHNRNLQEVFPCYYIISVFQNACKTGVFVLF